MSQTDSLTEKQRQRIRKYMSTWADLDFSNKKEAVQAVRGLYRALRMEVPRIKVFYNPVNCWKEWRRLTDWYLLRYRKVHVSRKERSEIIREIGPRFREDVRRHLLRPSMIDASGARRFLAVRPFSPSSYYHQIAFDGCAHAAGLTKKNFNEKRLKAWEQVAKKCFWIWPAKDLAVICLAPKIKRDMNGRFHNEKAPAVKFGKYGMSLYFWHGVHVPKSVILWPGEIEIPEIMEEQNLEVRRVMIERYGMEKFFKESGARLIHKGDLGELYEIRLRSTMLGAGPAPPWLHRAVRRNWDVRGRMTVVKVKNSTPEKDGTYKYYYLQVPNDMLDADQAVAWTFGYRSARRYKKALQQET